MPFLEAAGRYPEGPGSEETGRRPSHTGEQAASTGGRLSLSSTGRPRILRRGARMHAGALVALALIAALALLVPLRTLHISADGKTITARSRNVDSDAVVRQAGVSLRAGDGVDRHGDALVISRATDVLLAVDGRTYAVRAQADTIAELLDRAGVRLGADDSVVRDGWFVEATALLLPTASRADQPLTIAVRRAVPFTVIENGQQLSLRSSRGTLAVALRDTGLRLGAGDNVQPSLDTPPSAGMNVHIDRARELVVTLPEGRSTVYTVGSTVGDALAASGVTLPADYRLDPPAETAVSAGLAVHVIGITEQQDLETERIQSYVVYQPDPTLPHGTQRVVDGQDGVHYRQFEVVSEDGTQVSHQLSSEWDDPPAVDTIVYYSTAPAPPVPAHESSGQWRDIVCSYDWDCDWALAVIACESGGNPDAYNPQGYVGLFQIWEDYGANLRDPATNIAAAYSIYTSHGTSAWPNCP